MQAIRNFPSYRPAWFDRALEGLVVGSTFGGIVMAFAVSIAILAS